MRQKDFYYNSEPKNCTSYATLFMLFIFCLTVAAFALLEVQNFYSDQPIVERILMDSIKNSKEKESLSNNFMLDNLEDPKKLQQQDKEKLLGHIITQQELNSERQARAASDNKTSTAQKSNTYYEEQTPVVVFSKTDTDSSLVQKQMADVPPKQDTDEEDPFSRIFNGDYGNTEDNDYFGQPEHIAQQAQTYYQQPSQLYDKQQSPQTYYRQQQNYYPKQAEYNYDSTEYFPDADNQQLDTEQPRASQYNSHTNYYRQYSYATLPPMPSAQDNNRNLQLSSEVKTQQQNREPYPAYMDDYDYQPPFSHSPAPASRQSLYKNRKTLQQISQYRQPNTALQRAEEQQDAGEQMDFLAIFKSLKSMWDLYQSFTSSWNTIAEKSNREEEMAKQKYNQMQRVRINSRKPPKFNSKRNGTVTSKNSKKQITAISAAVTPITHEEEGSQEKQQSMAKVDPLKASKNNKMRNKDADSLRNKRQAASGGMKQLTTVANEGRYIKGDPLKGYYDFVITEGSYKFWAAFQVGTAILIIYSTFAAIYYSKVNPLVSDYDYTDYLGGARSLSGGEDLDFVDDFAPDKQKSQQKSWLEWLPRTGHSLQFILEAIDKVPTDHKTKESQSSEAINKAEAKIVGENNKDFEYKDDTDYLDETKVTTETDYYSHGSQYNEDLNLDNKAM